MSVDERTEPSFVFVSPRESRREESSVVLGRRVGRCWRILGAVSPRNSVESNRIESSEGEDWRRERTNSNAIAADPLRLAAPQIFDQHCEFFGHDSFHSQRIGSVEFRQMIRFYSTRKFQTGKDKKSRLTEKIISQLARIRQTLNRGVHETGIRRIVDAREAERDGDVRRGETFVFFAFNRRVKIRCRWKFI